MKKFTLFCIAVLGFLLSCGGGPSRTPGWNEGSIVKSPVYHEKEPIEMLSATGFKQLGKIYYQAPFLFLNEKGVGLNIIDNSDPQHPENVKFIRISGNYDLAMKGNYLYVNHIRDLVLLRVDEDRVVELQRLTNAFSNTFNDYPANYRGYFICPDPEQGEVFFWEDIVPEEEPNCRI